MNKRQAKKRMNKAIKSGVGVLIITQAWIDEAGENVMLCRKMQGLLFLNVLRFNILSLQNIGGS